MSAELKEQLIESLPWLVCCIVGTVMMIHAQPELVIGYALYSIGNQCCKDIREERKKKQTEARYAIATLDGK